MGVIMPDNRFRYSKDVDSFPSRGFELDLPRSKTFKLFSRKNMLSTALSNNLFYSLQVRDHTQKLEKSRQIVIVLIKKMRR